MFYIWLIVSSPANYYWNQAAQNWTGDHHKATLFNTFAEADAEALYASDYGPGEAVVVEVPPKQ
jgi:hypothetical protein